MYDRPLMLLPARNIRRSEGPVAGKLLADLPSRIPFISFFAFTQEKKVTIVHGNSQLLNDTYPDKFRRAAEKSVTSRGVKLVLDDYVDQEFPVNGLVTTRRGTTLSADLVVSPYISVHNQHLSI
jgi:hypothetical protein